MSSILGIFWRELRIRMANPIFPMWDVIVPAFYLVVFGASFENWLKFEGETGYTTFFLGGVLGMVTFSVAMNSSYAFFEDMQSGIFQELLTYPFPRRNLLLGKFLFNAALSVVGALMCLLAAVLLLDVTLIAGRLLQLMVWVVIGTAAWFFLTSWMSLRIRTFNGYHTVSSTMYLLLMFVSNLFYPAEELPRWAAWLAAVNPLTWQVNLHRRDIYGAGNPGELWVEAAGFMIFTLASFALANRALNQPIE
jgi:ABC-2 type transport system permease protein